ncbi:hypothetical protein AGMMS50262_14260 [Bacteroidia bacterium]|nr:hypothetical protein AGMMS50262_14260 [Bacteroidia bacterium]
MVLTILFSLLCVQLQAQVVQTVISKDVFRYEEYRTLEKTLQQLPVESAKTLRMGKVDVEKLLKEDAENAPKGVPFQFGYGFDTNYTLEAGTWEKWEKWHVWTLNVSSPGAYSLNFVFDNFRTPDLRN